MVQVLGTKHCLGFLRRVAQCHCVDACDAPPCNQPGKLRRRVGPRDHDDGNAVRDLLQTCASAARCAGGVRASWKLSSTMTLGFGSSEKRSLKKPRAKRARSCCGSEVNKGSAAAFRPATRPQA